MPAHNIESYIKQQLLKIIIKRTEICCHVLLEVLLHL